MSTAARMHVPLSESPLWRLQRQYFDTQGPRAWTSGRVPHYVTSHPFLARSFAEVLVGFAADCARARPIPAGETRTLYVVELGAGPGKLAWNIARALRTALDATIQGWRPVYVLTDVCEATLAWWQQHPCLAPLFDAGLLDLARFDATTDTALHLRRSGRTLDAAHPADELAVVANYVFDSLPHDVFESRAGELHEWLAAAPSIAADPAGTGFTRTELSWRTRPLAGRRYADDVHDAILRDYADAGGVFSLPCAALGALDRLRALTRGPLLVLSADKGDARPEDVVGDGAPSIIRHGSISMMVNYHALGAWALHHGGSWLHNEHHHRALEVCVLLLGVEPTGATLAVFERAIAQRGPDDFYTLGVLIGRHAAELSAGELLAYLRISGYDPKLFLDCASALRAAVVHASAAERDDLVLALTRIRDAHFPVGARDGEALDRALRELATALMPRALAPAEDPFDVASGRAL